MSFSTPRKKALAADCMRIACSCAIALFALMAAAINADAAST
jgi:hypothetical protein